VGAVVEAAPLAVKQGRNEGSVLRNSVPVYAGQPGTFVFGGARPPPQSRGSQISPVSGSNQWVMPSAHCVKLWVAQPTATAVLASMSSGMAERSAPLSILGGVLL